MKTFNKETILSVASSFNEEIERLTTERDQMYLDLILNHKEIWNHLQKKMGTNLRRIHKSRFF
jgi:hypothetical protein